MGRWFADRPRYMLPLGEVDEALTPLRDVVAATNTSATAQQLARSEMRSGQCLDARHGSVRRRPRGLGCGELQILERYGRIGEPARVAPPGRSDQLLDAARDVPGVDGHAGEDSSAGHPRCEELPMLHVAAEHDVVV